MKDLISFSAACRLANATQRQGNKILRSLGVEPVSFAGNRTRLYPVSIVKQLLAAIAAEQNQPK